MVNVADVAPLREMDRLLLEAFADVQNSNRVVQELAQRLHLQDSFVLQTLTQFQKANLVCHKNETWHLTDEGTRCLESEGSPAFSQQRRAFYFEAMEEGGSRFLPLHRPSTHALTPPEDWTFSPSELKACLQQNRQWKQRHGLSLDVQSLVDAGAEQSWDDWQRLIVDHAEECYLLLVLTDKGELRGYSLQPHGWRLSTSSLVLRLDKDYREVMPEIQDHEAPELWKQAWLNWGRPRQLPRKELEECEVKRDGLQLRIATPDSLYATLKRNNSEALKGDAWLMVGEGRARQLCQVRIVKEL